MLSQEEPSAVDPALVGRELGPWTMVSPWITLSLAVVIGAVLVWYFVRLGRPEVPRGRRFLRRVSIVLAVAALFPLVRGLSFVHPHEDRVAWALAWSSVLLALVACLALALIDLALVARGAREEYRALRRATLGGKSGSDGT